MRIRYRLVLIIAIAALLPLLVTGWVTAKVADDNMLRLSEELQLLQAKELSTLTETWMWDRVQGLQAQVRIWGVEDRSPAAQEGLLVAIYGQYDAVNVVALLAADGELIAGPIYQENPDPLGEWAEHDGVSPERAAQLIERAPWASAGATGAAVGRPYQPDGARAMVVPIAVASGRVGGAVLAVELSLDWLGERFSEHRVEGQSVALLDGSGTVLLGAASELLDPSTFGSFDGNLEGELTTTLADGTELLQTFDSVSDLGWDVVVAAPLSSTREAGREIREAMYFFYGLAALLTAVVGLMGAAQIARPVVALKDAALAVAEGELGRRVEPGGSLELSELGSAFNFMSRRLRQNREELDSQAAEIEAFNRELQQRVDERTRELTQAQARLVESSRLAAVAHMGAGLAHELNNPVAGILGMTQLAIARSNRGGDLGPTLRSIESQAQRCREILATLNRLTSDGPGERRRLELHDLVDSVLELARGSMAERGVSVDHQHSAALYTDGDAVRLGQAVSQLIRSLSLKLDRGGTLHITGAERAGGVELQLTLRGPQREARDDWLASGMGFWIAHQVVGQHQGWLEEGEEEGAPSYRLFLPAAEG